MRPIDAVQVLNDINWHHKPTPVSEFESGFNQGLNQAMWIITHAPTLTPPNEPLTIEQLREMDEPVWVACKTIEGGGGYWCLCRYGHITTPAGTFFEVGEIRHWAFYRRPPERQEDTNA